MTEQEKMRLDEQLEQAAKQLTHALRALRTGQNQHAAVYICLLYTSPSPRDS